jgi:Kef-type K+ transport system membrane component KefB
MNNQSVITLFLALGVIIAVAKMAGSVAQAVGQPRVFGKLLAGVILGPSLLNFLHLPALATADLEQTINQLAELGVLLLMFKVGMEVHVHELLSVGRVALLAGVLGAITPIMMAVPLARAFGFSDHVALFVGVVLAATSVSISAQTMLELGVLRTKEGRALLAAAVVDDVVAILLLSMVVATSGGESAPQGQIALVVARIIGYSIIALAVAWFGLPRIFHRLNQPSHGRAAFAWVVALLFGWSAEAFGGMAPITGAFIAGLGFSRVHEKARHEIESAVGNIAYAFLVPIFFVHIGLATDLRQISPNTIPFALLLLGIAILSKIIGSGLGARLGGFGAGPAFRLGVSMISRGEVGLIVASTGLARGVFDAELFPGLILVILLTTVLTPVLVRFAFRERGAHLQAQLSASTIASQM